MTQDVSKYRRGLAWRAGVRAHQQGRTRETCDRPRGTIYFDDWQDGFSTSENGEISQ